MARSVLLVVPYGIESLDSFGLIQPDGIICCMKIINWIAVVIIIVVTLVAVVVSRVLR